MVTGASFNMVPVTAEMKLRNRNKFALSRGPESRP